MLKDTINYLEDYNEWPKTCVLSTSVENAPKHLGILKLVSVANFMALHC